MQKPFSTFRQGLQNDRFFHRSWILIKIPNHDVDLVTADIIAFICHNSERSWCGKVHGLAVSDVLTELWRSMQLFVSSKEIFFLVAESRNLTLSSCVKWSAMWIKKQTSAFWTFSLFQLGILFQWGDNDSTKLVCLADTCFTWKMQKGLRSWILF